MELIDRYTSKILVLGLLICLAGASSIRLAALRAEEKPAPPSIASTPTDANETRPAQPAPADQEKNVDPNNPSTDPNIVAPENDNDIFDVKLSTLVLINEAYDRIFTPELITENGLVKYSTLKRKRLDILTVQRELKDLNPAVLMTLSREQRIAFWINTYNFCTIELILRYYPIQPKWYMIIYPDNSIMQITGAWTREFFEIQQLEYTLQEIEQEFLLDRYKDPRICFALSNAAAGGPILRNEPYRADRLNEQLDDQVRKYLRTDKGMRWDKENGILYLSNIFQVHTDTFLESDLADIKKFRDRKDTERIWLNFILPYLSEEDIRYLESSECAIKFIDFDWHLNESR